MFSEILLVGGDARQTCLTELLEKRFPVRTLGVPDRKDTPPSQPSHIILPCPAFLPDGTVRGGVSLSDVAPWLNAGVTVFAGLPGNRLREYPVLVVDLLSEEGTVTENARLTAEAAMLLVMQETGQSLRGRSCTVLGFGRIGKLLALLLRDMGASVTVLARKSADRALAASLGMRTVSPADRPEEDVELLFNTIPAQVLPDEVLSALPPCCLWVELASAPGGLPYERPLPFRVLSAGGLPGKLLPVSAAQILYRAVLRFGN